MKNKTTILVLIATFLTLGNGCKENENNNSDKPNDDNWKFSFYISDSAGNNLLPYELPDSPIVNPNSFHANPLLPSDRFKFGHGIHKNMGRIFYFSDRIQRIITSDYFIDTIYRVRLCLNDECDTIAFRIWAGEKEKIEIDNVKRTGYRECSAKWAIFRGDTIFDLPCYAYPLIVK